MIVEFTIENFRSFKEKSTFSLLATPKKELLEQNTFTVTEKLRLLKSAVLYGANASGKSNFFNALLFFRNFAMFSGPRKQIGDMIETNPFAFSKQTITEPSSFELIFFIKNSNDENIRYRYGFSVTQQNVVGEYLFAVNNVREVTLFTRNNQDIVTTEYFKEGFRLKTTTRPNCSFLSICAQNNGEIATTIISYFKQILVTSGIQNISHFTKNSLRKGIDQKKVVDFLKYADIQVNNVAMQQIPVDINTLPSQIAEFVKNTPQNALPQQETFFFGHTLFDEEKPVGDVLLPEQLESSGTQKLFSYSIPVFNALENGTPLFIDEFDAQLHPLIIESIIKLFNSPIQNPHNAQLVISCHSVNILTNDLFRRDQIWFCSKDEYGATELYSLVEYEEPVRNDAAFNKNYLRGKYGAIPFIDEINLRLGQEIDGT
jgi:AAA15 family ATPase/GTPase